MCKWYMYLFSSFGLSSDDGFTYLIVLGSKGGSKWSIFVLVLNGEVDGGVVKEDAGTLALLEGYGHMQSTATCRVLQTS